MQFFMTGIGIGFVGGFLLSVAVLDHYYRDCMKKMIDEIHAQYKIALDNEPSCDMCDIRDW